MDRSQVVERLTPREQEVLELLRAGLTDAEIGVRLSISRSAASHHVGEIIGKLGVRNRHEAAYYPERPPWWLALTPPFLRLRPVPSLAALAAIGVFAIILAALGLVAFLLTRGGGATTTSPAVVDGTLRLPQGAISALDSFAFTTTLEVSAADGDYGLAFEGAFEKPDTLQGTLQLQGKFVDIYGPQSGPYARPDAFESIAIGSHVWWRAAGDEEWQPGVEEGYEQSDPMIFFRQYATPFFYLEALRFDELDLPASSETEEIDGVRAIAVHLNKQGVIDVMAQGTGHKAYPEEEQYGEGVRTDNAQQVLPQQFNIDVWFEEHDLYPVRIVFDYAVTEDDYSNLAFGFEDPMTLRLQMDITDPERQPSIEPPEPIPTLTPTPTTVPGELEPGQAALIAETAIADPALRPFFDAAAPSGGGSVGTPFFIWRASGGEVLGGAVYATLAAPIDFEGDWPAIVYDESLDPPFTEVTHHYRVEGVTQLWVLVYLPELRVVEVRPADGAVVSGTPPPPATIPGGTPLPR